MVTRRPRRFRTGSGYLIPISLVLIAAAVLGFELHRESLDVDLVRAMECNDTRAVLRLVDQGADANMHASDRHARTLKEFVFDLIHARASADRSHPGPSVLEIAVAKDNTDAVRALLTHGATQVNAKVVDRQPRGLARTFLLLIAVANGNRAITELLLDHGADVRVRDSRGDTALEYAVWPSQSLSRPLQPVNRSNLSTQTSTDRLMMTRLLIEHGADVHALSSSGQSVLDSAAESGLGNVVHYLLQQGAAPDEGSGDATALYYAALNDDLPMATELLDHGARVQLLTETPPPPIVGARSIPMLRLLLQHGADINAIGGTGNESARTALHRAVTQGDVAVAEFLLAHGANANRDCSKMDTPLMLAAQNRDTRLLQLLLERGATVEVKTGDGLTALMYAVQYSSDKGVELLLHYGADLHTRNDAGETPLSMAERNSNAPLMKRLLGAGANHDKR